jgi:hypothetical protein
MSILSIERNYGIIHKSEMPIDINVEDLVKSGFVRLEESDSVVFTLPILVQWLGARAIRNQLVDFCDIVDDESRLLKWRYSISIMFNQMTYEESENYFSYLVENRPDMAGIIIRDGITFEGTIDVSDANQSGKKMYRCMQSWIKGIGGLADTLGVSSNGVVNTLAILCKEHWMEFSWGNEYVGQAVITLKDAAKFNCFKTVHGRGVPAQATWPWVITFEYLSKLIEDGLKRHKWLVLDGIMEREYLWKNTLKLKKKGSLYADAFEIEDINTYKVKKQDYQKIDMKTYFYLVDRMKENGDTQIKVPYIVGDTEYKNNFIWGNYSKLQMKRRVENIYKNVLDEYIKMVDGFFDCFKMQLSTYLILPCKLVGSLCFDDTQTDSYYGGPSLQYYLSPLEIGMKNEVEIKLQDDRDYLEHEAKEIFRKLAQEANKYRENSKEYISFSIYVGRCMDSTSTPVTDIVYKLLKDDLKRIGWVEG